MTDQTDSKARECLSAMVDNEAFELELFRTAKALSEDQELRQTWHRYHLASSVMQRQTSEIATDLSSQIASAIALEAELTVSLVEDMTLMDDTGIEVRGGSLEDKGVLQNNRGASLSNKGFQKFAVAASVAVAVVIGVQQLQPGSETILNNVSQNIASTAISNTTGTNALNIGKPDVADSPINPRFQLPSGYVLPRVNVQTVSTSAIQPLRNSLDVGNTSREFNGDGTDQQIQNYLNHMLLRHAEQGFLRTTPLPEEQRR